MAISKGIAFPWRRGSTGFPQMETGNALAISQLKQVLTTELGERRMRPNFGCALRRFLFEPRDSLTLMAVQAEVSRAINDSIPAPRRPMIRQVSATYEDVNDPVNGKIVIMLKGVTAGQAFDFRFAFAKGSL